MKVRKHMIFVFFVILLSFLVACSNFVSTNQDPKQLILDAINKNLEIESRSFEGSYTVSLDYKGYPLDQDTKDFLDILKDLKLSYKGVVQEDIEKAEIIIEAEINFGDARTTVEIPVMIEAEKMWVRVPNIPGLVPGEVAGQFVELDFKELAELSGEEYMGVVNPLNSEEQEIMNEFINEASNILVNDIDESFFSVTKEEGRVVTVDVSGEKFYQFLDNFITNSLPELFVLITNPKYSELFDLSLDEMEDLLKEVENDEFDFIARGLRDVKDFLELSKGEFSLELTKDGFISRQFFSIVGKFTDQDLGGEITISITGSESSSNFNGEQEFSLEKPPSYEIISIIELFELIYMNNVGYYEDFDYEFEDFDFEDYDFEDYDFEDFEFDYDFELTRLDELQYELAEQEWFNRSDIEDLFFLDDDLFDLLYDEEFLEMLLYDEKARIDWFKQHNIEF
ncbi:hypothetical protein [Bacillus alkalicellulosilyticus]|uniref:hypothetical protein n=1 Tax=Alkalihalobacterium alkalicellulosilyticum TaxID=1912214 RepID=UPI00099688E9|nr:hypothetical protein [Bacillus alkalicellulosilyticus]